MNKPPEAPTAAEILQRFKPTPEAETLVKPTWKPTQCVEQFLQAGLYKDALACTACSLGKQEAVWWGCLCLWHAAGTNLPAKGQAALAATVRWVLEPKEETRLAAAAAGVAGGGMATAAGALAQAAGWSSGSMAPPGLPEVKPPEFLTQNVVAAAVLLAAALAQPADPGAASRQFLNLAADVAGGKNRWEAKQAAPK